MMNKKIRQAPSPVIHLVGRVRVDGRITSPTSGSKPDVILSHHPAPLNLVFCLYTPHLPTVRLRLGSISTGLVPNCLSFAVFSSWQCRCNACKLSHLSLPPLALGVIWSISIRSSSLKNSPQWVHLPF